MDGGWSRTQQSTILDRRCDISFFAILITICNHYIDQRSDPTNGRCQRRWGGRVESSWETTQQSTTKAGIFIIDAPSCEMLILRVGEHLKAGCTIKMIFCTWLFYSASQHHPTQQQSMCSCECRYSTKTEDISFLNKSFGFRNSISNLLSHTQQE